MGKLDGGFVEYLIAAHLAGVKIEVRHARRLVREHLEGRLETLCEEVVDHSARRVAPGPAADKTGVRLRRAKRENDGER